MTLAALGLALTLLLLTPGPTNTLVLLAAMEGGLKRAMRLIPVELAAYFAVIVPLALVSEALAQRIDGMRPVVALLAGTWVFYLAWTMWHQPLAGSDRRIVSARRLAVTTLLNPKGLVMGVVLIPSTGVALPSFAMLAFCIIAVALIWALAGCCLPRRTGTTGLGALIPRVAAVWLAGLSLVIVAGGLSA